MNELLLILRFIGAGLLYLFLGVAFYIIWRSFSVSDNRCLTEPDPATLRVDNNSDRSFVLRPVTALGRAKDNDVVIDDPFASSNHAMIIWRDGEWWVEDLGSHNGTFVNEVATLKAAQLHDGDYIGIGQTNLQFRLEEEKAR
jgi:pSer/pThr/pTyr-binding forkhead associated (FHA) protein